ncbi:MAG: hypothetical protein GY711_32120 [bacterium]|nr:hypothetical protein [bacterium]
MRETIELLVQNEGDRVLLLAPDAGLFTRALGPGSALAAGQSAGTLLRLARASELVVPHGVHGVVVSERPDLVRAPVGHGDVLYELAPFDTAGEHMGTDAAQDDPRAGLHVAAPQTGRFYLRPAPDAEPFIAEGTILEDGAPIGLIEVMKTFTRIPYRAVRGLPARARVVRVLAGDGEDVKEGAPLVEIEAS